MSTRSQAISLYKNILRAHKRFLPHEMRQLGDAYVKAEFRLHQKVTKPEQLDPFFSEWNKYLIHVERVGREKQMVEAGLVDSSSSSRHQHHQGNNNNDTSNMNGQRSNNRQSRGFGKDVSSDVTFNEEQQGQLSKLREEAEKAGVNR
ncbi:hypothetical protein ACHAWC_004251 [Mediolabrus comicus]